MAEPKRIVTEKGVEILTPAECLQVYARAAAVLQSPAWAKLPSERESAYGDHLDAVFDKLESAASFQLRCAVKGGLRETKDLDLEILGPIVGREIQQFVERELDGQSKKSAFAEGAKKPGTLRERVREDLSIEAVRQVNTSWHYHYGKAPGSNDNFYIRNAVDSLAIYLKALDTLAGATPKPAWFEKALKESLSDAQYMVQGYPHDLLVHDVVDIESHGPVYGVARKVDYLSTHCMKSEKDVEMLKGMGEFRMALNPDFKQELAREQRKSSPGASMSPAL